MLQDQQGEDKENNSPSASSLIVTYGAILPCHHRQKLRVGQLVETILLQSLQPNVWSLYILPCGATVENATLEHAPEDPEAVVAEVAPTRKCRLTDKAQSAFEK